MRRDFSRWLARRSHRRGVLLRGLLALLFWAAVVALAANAFAAAADPLYSATEPVQTITQATLRTAAGERQVYRLGLG